MKQIPIQKLRVKAPNETTAYMGVAIGMTIGGVPCVVVAPDATRAQYVMDYSGVVASDITQAREVAVLPRPAVEVV